MDWHDKEIGSYSLSLSDLGGKLLMGVASLDESPMLEVDTGQGDGTGGEQLALRFSTVKIEKERPVVGQLFTGIIQVGVFSVQGCCDDDGHLNIYINPPAKVAGLRYKTLPRVEKLMIHIFAEPR